jgi:hypothetical protein
MGDYFQVPDCIYHTFSDTTRAKLSIPGKIEKFNIINLKFSIFPGTDDFARVVSENV